MVEKLDPFEVLREVSAMIDSVGQSERRQVMAALAERYGFKLAAPQSSGNGYRPAPRRGKVKAW